jgi:peroxiredoxin Q/BCP
MPATAKKALSELNVGDKAPAFNLPVDGGEVIDIADYKGKKNVVIYFYPKDDTPGCTVEAKEFRDLNKQFQKTDTVVIGVSKDSCASHDKFKAKYDLNFIIASDEKGDVCERFGVWVEKNMYGKKYMGIARATFLIGKDGKIAAIWPKVKPEGHADEVLKKAQTL